MIYSKWFEFQGLYTKSSKHSFEKQRIKNFNFVIFLLYWVKITVLKKIRKLNVFLGGREAYK